MAPLITWQFFRSSQNLITYISVLNAITMYIFYLMICLVNQFLSGDTPCGEYRNRKKSDSVFQDVKVLTLSCNRTFSYRQSNCIHPNKSAGTWSLAGNMITLRTSDKLIKLALKEKKSDDGYLYSDLSGQSLQIDNSSVIWKRSNTLTDTLYKK